MKVYFRNDTPERIWVAVMYYSPDACREYGRWGTGGWFEYAPGEQAWVIDTNNLYVYFYAESETGRVWSGHDSSMYVYREAFDSCKNIGSTAGHVVGLHEKQMLGGDTIFPLVI